MQSKRRIQFPESIYVACIPIFAYLMAFSFECGFLSVFNIPYDFISINLYVIVFASTTIFFTLIIPINALAFIPIKDKKNRDISLLFLNLIPYFLFLVLIILYGSNWQNYGFTGLFIVLLLLMRLMVWFMSKSDNDTNENDISKTSRITLSMKYISNKIPMVFLIIILTVLVSFEVGRAEAIYKNKYLISDSSLDRLIIRIYNDKIISVPYERETNSILPYFYIKTFSNTHQKMQLFEIDNPKILKIPSIYEYVFPSAPKTPPKRVIKEGADTLQTIY